MDFKEVLQFLYPRLATFVTAMTPIGELRASIPLALTTYNMGIIESFIISVLGNLVPVVVIIWALEPISRYLMRKFHWAYRFFTWLFNRTRRKYSARFEKYKGYALIGFVGIPLPVTGGWTGALIAFVFGIPPRKAIVHIIIGVLLAGIIVTTVVETVGYVRFIIAG
jgi:uncharacterized membrane protein